MNQPTTLDEVLFAFHRAVHVPRPEDVTRWTKDYPQFADEIRAHAAEIVDMEALADEGADALGTSVTSPSGVRASVPLVGGTTLRDVVRARGWTLAEFADELGISPAIVSDVNSGRIRAETVGAKFLRRAGELLGQTAAEFAAVVVGPKQIPAAARLKSRSGRVEGRPMTWAEAVNASDMDDARKAFWLSDEE